MRVVVCVLLALLAMPARAQWEVVAKTFAVVIYINPASLRKDGDLREVWSIQDLRERDEDGEMSRLVLLQLDCREELFRPLAASTHDEPMAFGATLFSSNRTFGWQTIPPGSLAGGVLKVVCAR